MVSVASADRASAPPPARARGPGSAPSPHVLHLITLLCFTHLAVACGPSADGYPYLREAGCEEGCDPMDAGRDAGPPGDAGPPEIPDEPLEDWDEEGAGPLTGVFAVEVIIPARAVVDLESRQLYRLRILQRDDQVRMRISPCRFALPSIPSVATLTIPPRLEEVLRAISIEDDGPFLSAADPIGATLSTPRSIVVLGADLTDPENDPLPTTEMPERAIDQDEDGNPGVTLFAETVLCRMPEEAYITLRATVEMTATVEDLDRIEGAVTPTLDQTVLGISDRCLTAATTLTIEILEGSAFTAVRVGEDQDLDDNGNVSCPEIAWYAPRLFGEYWSSVR